MGRVGTGRQGQQEKLTDYGPLNQEVNPVEGLLAYEDQMSAIFGSDIGIIKYIQAQRLIADTVSN